jgi:SAM-dependent methyltransferase
MRSPWLDIPLADYEGHMALPGIGQAQMLADQFAELLAQWVPRSAAVIGCAGGNGFDRVRCEVTQRVVGIDINPHYVQALADRHAASTPGLELYVRDIQEPIEGIDPVDLIYAALVLEYVDLAAALRHLKSICRPNGILATVLQLPSEGSPQISQSPFTRLKDLGPAMHLVAPASLISGAAEQGFLLQSTRHLKLSSAKEFLLQVFQCGG